MGLEPMPSALKSCLFASRITRAEIETPVRGGSGDVTMPTLCRIAERAFERRGCIRLRRGEDPPIVEKSTGFPVERESLCTGLSAEELFCVISCGYGEDRVVIVCTSLVRNWFVYVVDYLLLHYDTDDVLSCTLSLGKNFRSETSLLGVK
jgi:hypothetical protein